MAEEKKDVNELLKQINDFEQTLKGLEGNVNTLKQRLLESKEKYGTDISKWPKDAK